MLMITTFLLIEWLASRDSRFLAFPKSGMKSPSPKEIPVKQCRRQQTESFV
jgi:hypothetical protein